VVYIYLLWRACCDLIEYEEEHRIPDDHDIKFLNSNSDNQHLIKKLYDEYYRDLVYIIETQEICDAEEEDYCTLHAANRAAANIPWSVYNKIVNFTLQTCEEEEKKTQEKTEEEEESEEDESEEECSSDSDF